MEYPKIWNWLKPSEVYSYLKSASASIFPTISHYSVSPESGDIFYIKKSEFKRWKQDGHSYISRKNGSGTREDREKYSFESEVIQCTYVHGSGTCPSCKKTYLFMCSECSLPITSVLFHRRAYWLLSNPDLILVHYLDESQKSMHLESDSISGQSNAEEQIKRLSEVLRQIDFENITPVQIIEFCPEWADVHGGCKVLVCIDPPFVVPNPQNLFCVFGQTQVHIEPVQFGVFKCFTPVHSPGIFDFFLVYEGIEITQSRKEFEFKEIKVMKSNNFKVEWWEKEKNEIQNEMIEEIQADLQEKIEENEFDESFFLTQFAKIVRIENWEKIKSTGKCYLHYLCALGYSNVIKAIGPCIKYSNVRDNCSKSPIDIALSKHHYDCVYELIKIGENLEEGNDFMKSEESLNDRIQKIQSHVRAWLQQKQFKNLKSAAKTLQKTFRGMIARKNFKYQKQAAIIIQKSVRKWLVSTYHQKHDL